MPHATPRWNALLRAPAPSLASVCELTHLARQPIDFTRAQRQHAGYAAALDALGVQVRVLPPLPAQPDSVFVEDAALVLDEAVLLCRPGVASRAAEPALLRESLEGVRPALHVLDGGTLDGGDVLRVGRTLLVGRSRRTDAEGIAALARQAGALGYRVQPVDVHGSLHLKTACTALDAHTLLLNPDWIDAAALTGFQHVHVAEDEPFAANLLRLPHAWLANAAHPRTLATLEREAQARGVALRAVHIDEFAKAEAGLTCLSLVYPTL